MSHTRMVDPGASAAACLGAVLRRLRTLQGLTQAGLGPLVGYDGSYVSAVERAAARPSRELVERCDRALRADGVLVMLWSLADPTERPPAAGAAGSAPEVGIPDDGPGPDPEALIPAVRAQLRYAGRLLEARPTLGQHRRLLVVAGWLSVLLARLRFDAGDREAAEASRDAGFRLARQAGHAELAAWAVEALALWALVDGRFGDALELARAGQDLAPPASAAAVQLALDEAQAWTSLGERDQAEGARRQAALTRAMLPAAAS